MVTRRVVKGVLGNFLGTYVSRHSDYDGYWLFGFLVGDLGELRIDLLGQGDSDPSTPLGAAALSAAAGCEDQWQKAGLVRAQLRDAQLTIQRLPGSVDSSVNGHSCAGFNVRFLAEAVTDDGKPYERQRVVFVAPHNPEFERQVRRL